MGHSKQVAAATGKSKVISTKAAGMGGNKGGKGKMFGKQSAKAASKR